MGNEREGLDVKGEQVEEKMEGGIGGMGGVRGTREKKRGNGGKLVIQVGLR